MQFIYLFFFFTVCSDFVVIFIFSEFNEILLFFTVTLALLFTTLSVSSFSLRDPVEMYFTINLS